MKKIVAGMMNALLRFTSSLKAEVRSTRTHSLFPSTRLLSRFPYRLRTIWDAYYPVKRIRMGVHGCLPGGKKEPPGAKARGVLVVPRSRRPYALAPSGWGAVASEPRLGGRTINATAALATMMPARIKKASE